MDAAKCAELLDQAAKARVRVVQTEVQTERFPELDDHAAHASAVEAYQVAASKYRRAYRSQQGPGVWDAEVERQILKRALYLAVKETESIISG